MRTNTTIKKLFTAVLVLLSCLPAWRLQAQDAVPGKAGMHPSFISFKNAPPAFVKGSVLLTDEKGRAAAYTPALPLRTETDKLGMEHYRYQQSFAGIPIENAVYIMHVKDGKVISQNGDWVKDFPAGLATTATLSKSQALDKALGFVHARQYKWQVPGEEARVKREHNDAAASFYPQAELVYYCGDAEVTPSALRLAYKMDIYAHDPMSHQLVFVDALTGKVLGKRELIHSSNVTGTALTAYSGEQTITTDMTGANSYRLRETTRGNGINTYNYNIFGSTDFTDTDNYWNNVNAAMDQYATDAHWGAEKTYDYYKNRFNRNSLDNNGFTINSYVHRGADNAFWQNGYMFFWDGSAVYYGDGNATMTPLTALDIVGHELSHGLVQYSANLAYQGESGALNEAFSDIFGTAIEFYARPSRANWTIGEDIGTIFRSMSAPTSYWQPNTYKGTYWKTVDGCTPTRDNDYCGVHTNSGVLNFWFYLLSQGGSGTNDIGKAYTVTGIGIDKAAAIAYRLLTAYLTSTATYANARTYGIQAAIDLYGANSTEAMATANAFYAVGINPDCIPGAASTSNSGNALSFDGVNDYVEVRPDVYFKGNFTIEAWVYPRSFTNWSRILDFGNGPGVNSVLLSMTTGTNGYPTLRVEGAQFQATTPFTLNSWNHVAATLSGTTATIYINGQPAGTATLQVPMNVTRQYCYIGRSNWSGDGYANAIFDEIRIWSIARAQTDIQNTMNTELTGFEPGLAVYYNCNEGIAWGANTGADRLVDNTNGISNGVLKNFTLSGATGYSNWSPGKGITTSDSVWVGSLLQLNNASSGTWSSFNSGIASVSNSGLVTAIAAGTTTIALKTGTDDCSKYATTTITVVPVPVITGSGSICKVGETTALSANVPGGKWESSNNTVATVDANTGVVTAKSTGSCTIYYTMFLGGYKKEATFTINTSNLTADWKMSTSLVYSFTSKDDNCTYQWYYNGSPVWLATTKSFYLSLVYDPRKVGLVVKANGSSCSATRNGTSGSHIHLLDVPVAEASATTICRGDSVTLSTTPESNDYYIWSTNADGTGVVGSEASIKVAPAATTTYYLTAVDDAGHFITDGGTTITVNSGPAPANNNRNGLHFDGTDDFVAVYTNTNIPVGNAIYSIEAWVKPDIHTSNGIVGWGNWGTTNQTTSFRLGDNNTVRNGWYNTELTVNSGNLADGKWHHLACTFDGTTRKIYVDGVLKGQDNPTGHNVPNASNLKIGTIGIPALGNVQNFKGGMDEVRIWRTARTQAQILAAMNTELTGSENGLAAYYTFNRGAVNSNNAGVTTLADKTSNANNGTLTNFALTGSSSNWVPGCSASPAVSNGLHFDGSNDYISFTSNPPYTNGSTTVEAWINTTSNTGGGTNIVTWANTSAQYSIEFRELNGKLQFGIWDGSSWQQVTSKRFINTGTWVHVAVVTENTAAGLYINGTLDTIATIANSIVPSAFNIGISSITGTPQLNRFTGLIDEVRIWNVPRTQVQLQANMNTELAGNEAGLQAYYNFNQGKAEAANAGITNLPDRTANGRTGTLRNFALTGITSNWMNGAVSNAASTTTCTGTPLQLNNSTAGGVWTSSNMGVATVSSTGLVSGAAVGNANISYTVTNAGGCKTTVVTPVNIIATGSGCTAAIMTRGQATVVEQPTITGAATPLTPATGIRLFPNPAHSRVTLQLAAGMERATVTVMSVLGVTLFTDNSTGLLRVMNLAGAKSGTYWVKVTAANGSSTAHKLVLE